jgi:hypothetical protein
VVSRCYIPACMIFINFRKRLKLSGVELDEHNGKS